MQNKDKARLARAKAAAGTVGTIIAKAVCATCFLMVLVGGTYLYAKYQTEATLRTTHEAELQAEAAKRYGREGAEFNLLAQAILEECGGVPDEWQLCFEAKIGRVDSDLFPNTIELVLKQKGSKGNYQFSFVNDDVHPHVITEQGDAIRAALQPLWQAWQAGTYEYQYPGIHSFCVPAACEASNAYFGQFEMVFEGEGHRYFSGLPMESVSSLAVAHSLRPKARLSKTDLAVRLALDAG